METLTKVLNPVGKIVIDGSNPQLQPYNQDGTHIAAAVNGIAGETFDAVYAKLQSNEAFAVDDAIKEIKANYAKFAARKQKRGQLGTQGAKELFMALSLWVYGNEV